MDNTQTIASPISQRLVEAACIAHEHINFVSAQGRERAQADTATNYRVKGWLRQCRQIAMTWSAAQRRSTVVGHDSMVLRIDDDESPRLAKVTGQH
ncbi:MAG: hypothetical protein VB032_00650 [Burkholderiaceae bacterium]|nr:hypothetical protein [Burkholderiaceae bacterium]